MKPGVPDQQMQAVAQLRLAMNAAWQAVQVVGDDLDAALTTLHVNRTLDVRVAVVLQP
jgi:hypothetical protein